MSQVLWYARQASKTAEQLKRMIAAFGPAFTIEVKTSKHTIVRDDLHILRSMANEQMNNAKPKELDAHEFTALCWLKALQQRYPELGIAIELPTRFNPRPDKGYKP